MSNVVLFRCREGNALVGVVEDRSDEAWHLSAVAVVRYWGTTQGFPELCGGPTAKTICDVATLPAGTLAEVSRKQVIYALPADEAKWREVLRVVR